MNSLGLRSADYKRALAGCLGIGLLLLAGGQGPALAEEHPFKIGIIAPLSGDLHEAGDSVMNCAKLAVEDGGYRERVVLIGEDSAFQAKNAITAFNKLAAEDKVDAVISFGSSPSLPLVELAQRTKIPLFVIAITDKVLGKQGVYRYFVSLDDLRTLTNQGIKARGYRSIALVAAQNDAALGLRDGIVQAKAAEVVINEEVNPAERDLRVIAAKIKAKSPDAVGLLLLSPQLSILAAQLRAVGYKGEFFSAPPIQLHSEIAAAGGALDRVWYAGTDDHRLQGVADAYQARFGYGAHLDGCLSYELVDLIVKGLSSQNGGLIDFIAAQKSYQTKRGDLKINENGAIEPPSALKIVSGNKFELYDPKISPLK